MYNMFPREVQPFEIEELVQLVATLLKKDPENSESLQKTVK